MKYNVVERLLWCHSRVQCHHSIVPAGGGTMITTFDAALPKMPSEKSDVNGVS